MQLILSQHYTLNIWTYYQHYTFHILWIHCHLPVKSCTFWPMISTRGHWAVRVLYRTYWDTGLPLIMVIPEDPWHTHQLPSVWLWNCQYLFLRLRFVVAGIRTPNHPHARLQHANPLRHCCGPTNWEKNKN